MHGGIQRPLGVQDDVIDKLLYDADSWHILVILILITLKQLRLVFSSLSPMLVLRWVPLVWIVLVLRTAVKHHRRW